MTGPLHYLIEPYRRYADFRGRSTRADYWWFVLLYAVTSIVVGLVGVLIDYVIGQQWVTGLFIFVLLLGSLLPNLALTARRIHDAGYSGWFQLLGLVPLGGFVVLIFCILPGEAGANKWGPNPRLTASRGAAPVS